MLSPATHHLSVPKSLSDNLAYRSAVLGLAEDHPEFRPILLEMCRDDVLWFISAWVWQSNPKKINAEVGPFIPWAGQEDAILRTVHRLFVEQDDVLWEKSRYQGATWMALIIDDWMSLFFTNKKFLAISHTEDAVDRAEDPDSLFWKVDFIHRHLPGWMKQGAKKRKLGFTYPATDSSFNGAATTERSGVGGRATALLLDEFSKHRKDREILGQTADTGPRLFIGTHYGPSGEFYDLTRRPDLFKIVMHWSQHPEQSKGLYRYDPVSNQVEVLDKTYDFPADYQFVMDGSPTGGPFPGLRSPWYDKECKRRGNARDVAMHLDIAPEESQSQFFEALTLRQLYERCVPPLWEGDLEYDHDAGRPIALTRMAGGPIKMWINPTGACAVPPGAYASGNDLSEGFGASNSVCAIAEATTGHKVLEYAACHLRPEAFAAVVVALCRIFKDENDEPAMLCWEEPGSGLAFGKAAKSLGYQRFFYRETRHLARNATRSKVPGWQSSDTEKLRLLSAYRRAIEERDFRNLSKEAISECRAYRYTENRDGVEHPRHAGGPDPSGARSKHGDRVIADAICWMVCQRLRIGWDAVKAEEEKKPIVGTLEWRMSLHAEHERSSLDRRPILRHHRLVSGVGAGR